MWPARNRQPNNIHSMQRCTQMRSKLTCAYTDHFHRSLHQCHSILFLLHAILLIYFLFSSAIPMSLLVCRRPLTQKLCYAFHIAFAFVLERPLRLALTTVRFLFHSHTHSLIVITTTTTLVNVSFGKRSTSAVLHLLRRDQQTCTVRLYRTKSN